MYHLAVMCYKIDSTKIKVNPTQFHDQMTHPVPVALSFEELGNLNACPYRPAVPAVSPCGFPPPSHSSTTQFLRCLAAAA